jgi:small subunit ribosomal protein S29
MSRYGLYDVSGIRDGEPEPCPRVWDPLKKQYNDVWKEQLYELELAELGVQYEKLNYRISQRLSDPKKLIEIVDAGIADPNQSICALAEVLEQLYNTDKYQTLISMDGFN